MEQMSTLAAQERASQISSITFHPPVTPGMHRTSQIDDARPRNDVPLWIFVSVDRCFYVIIIPPCAAPVTLLLWNPTQIFGREGANSRPTGAKRMVRSDEEMGQERQRGRDERTGVLPVCLTTAFSGGVPVVEGWEFPSVQAWRKATEDIFFRACQECPDLLVWL